MSCEKSILLHQYLKCELAEVEQKEMSEHIENCSECRNEVEELRSIRDKLKSIESVEPSKDFVEKLMTKLEVSAKSAFNGAEESLFVRRRSIWKIIADSFGLPGRVPAWAISSVFHIILFAVFSLFFYNSYKKEAEEKIEQSKPSEFSYSDYYVSYAPDMSDVVTDSQFEEIVKVFDDNYENDRIWLANYREKRNRMAENLVELLESEPNSHKLFLLNFIASQQNKNGSWNFDEKMVVGYTALASFSLQLSGANSKFSERLHYFSSVIENATKFVLSQKLENGLFSKSIDFDLFNHILACLMLTDNYVINDLNSNTKAVSHALDKLVENQNQDGSWDYLSTADNYGLRNTGSLIPTTWAIFTLKLAVCHPVLRDNNRIRALAKAVNWIKQYDEPPIPVIGFEESRYYLTPASMLFASALVTPLESPIMLKSKLKSFAKIELYDDEKNSIGNDFNSLFLSLCVVNSVVSDKSFASFISLSEEEKSSLLNWQKNMNEKIVKSIKSSRESRKKLLSDYWSSYGGEIYNASMMAIILFGQEAI